MGAALLALLCVTCVLFNMAFLTNDLNINQVDPGSVKMKLRSAARKLSACSYISFVPYGQASSPKAC
jgi:hypothetical protein